MSDKTKELFMLCINHMLDQSELMHEHIFGTQFHRRVLNHLGALFGRVIVRAIETEAYQKGKHDYLKMGRLAITEFKEYVVKYLRDRRNRTRFYEEVKSS